MTTFEAVKRLIAEGRINELANYVDEVERKGHRLDEAIKAIREINEQLGNCKNLEMPAVNALVISMRYIRSNEDKQQ